VQLTDLDGMDIPVGDYSLSQNGPAMPDVGVVALVSDDWDGPWMLRHQAMTRLRSYFHVVWVDPARDWRELWLPPSRAIHGNNTEIFEPFAGFTVYRPGRWLPRLYKPRPVAGFIAARRLRDAVTQLRDKGCRTFILYIWRPQFADALDVVEHDLSCYHIDDEYSFSDVDRPVAPAEAALIRNVDQVIVHSEGLMEKKGLLNPHTLLVPNGVDFRAFATSVPEPADLRVIPGPRIGYVGIVKKQLDLAQLLALARRHSAWSFVFVGPRGNLDGEAETVAALERQPNVRFLGARSVQDLPGYVQHMDVCTMCYKENDYTKYIYPLKMHEYLAGGRPVVATPIRSAQPFGDVIRLARGETEWSHALTASLAPDDNAPVRVAARRAAARPHDWRSLVERIAGTLCDRLGAAHSARFSEIDAAAAAE
jgi:glycosyltransferase involved in cell wall biosynthesis